MIKDETRLEAEMEFEIIEHNNYSPSQELNAEADIELEAIRNEFYPYNSNDELNAEALMQIDSL